MTTFFPLSIVLGAAVGSFLHVVVVRTRAGQSLVRPASRCAGCQRSLRWYENVPLLSYITLRGRCRTCRSSIGWSSVACELGTAIVWGWLLLAYGLTWQLAGALVLSAFLIIIFFYDLLYGEIPDRFSLPALACGLVFSILSGQSWLWLGASVLVGAGFFWAQYVVSSGRWIGGGDIRLGAAMGAMLGWPGILVALFIAYIAGSIVGVGLLLTGRKRIDAAVPFGTFLTFATLLTLVYGNAMAHWYIGLLHV